MKNDFSHLAVYLGFWVVIVILVGALIISAVRRMRRGATYGWGMIWWCLAGLAMFILYRPFYVKFRPSFVHWQALLGVVVVAAIWSGYGVQYLGSDYGVHFVST